MNFYFLVVDISVSILGNGLAGLGFSLVPISKKSRLIFFSISFFASVKSLKFFS